MSEQVKLEKIGRIAYRAEGDNWVAWYASTNTMDQAVYLGTIKLVFVQNEERRRTFVELMRDCVGDMFEAEYGMRPSWPDEPGPAPEHERAGRG